MNSTISATDSEKGAFWKEAPLLWFSFTVLVTLFAFSLYKHGLNRMVEYWFEKEEYSHGVMIPFITVFLIWQKKNALERIAFSGSWAGAAIILAGASVIALGNIAAITVLIQYGFVIALGGLFMAYMGWRGFKEIWVPFLLLIFMIPLPVVMFQGLSESLQLVSSSFGVWVIRLFGISVYLEGNVIDLGTYKLQVIEACSGLRYLFPLMTLGFIAAYFYKASFWKRAVVFLSSIPITVAMNSFRIGVIGVLVEYWGASMAEGFLHDFEGWVVFMASTGILVLEMWAFAKLGKDARPLRQVFGMDFPMPIPKDVQPRLRPIGRPYWLAAVMLVIVAISLIILPAKRDEVKVPRKEFADFPMALADWRGESDRMERIFIDTLKLDDYFIANYANTQQQPVSLYFAYYGSQSKGYSIHSPRACLPGGGWKLQEMSEKEISEIKLGSESLRVNRVGMQLGDSRQLVYYWFHMHGRSITNEYVLKWYVFWDALTLKRTDAALVRIITPLKPGENYADADSRLIEFTKTLTPLISEYVPN